MLVEYITPIKDTYLLNIPKELVNSRLEITLKKVRNTTPDLKILELIQNTAGLIKDRNIDVTEWQRNLRDEWGV
jgi:hypothetical protein